MWFAALGFATISFLVFVLTKMKGYSQYSARALYWTVVFVMIFVIGKTMEYFGY